MLTNIVKCNQKGFLIMKRYLSLLALSLCTAQASMTVPTPQTEEEDMAHHILQAIVDNLPQPISEEITEQFPPSWPENLNFSRATQALAKTDFAVRHMNVMPGIEFELCGAPHNTNIRDQLICALWVYNGALQLQTNVAGHANDMTLFSPFGIKTMIAFLQEHDFLTPQGAINFRSALQPWVDMTIPREQVLASNYHFSIISSPEAYALINRVAPISLYNRYGLLDMFMIKNQPIASPSVNLSVRLLTQEQTQQFQALSEHWNSEYTEENHRRAFSSPNQPLDSTLDDLIRFGAIPAEIRDEVLAVFNGQ
jgi:hypothetical protein